ncbi:MAG: glycosyltransferase family 4 protein [Anaerolineaceae bacterium]|nr:glycosyltransferase family 4 protein [Anaerolineaceae bacterium]
MRRILVLSPCDVFPPVHGSSTAIYHTLQFLAERNRVSVLLAHLYSQGGQIDLESPNLTIRYCRRSSLDRLGYKGLFFNPLYYQAALQIAREFQPDVIQAELLWTAPAALWLRHNIGRPVVLMQENVEYQKFVRFGLTSPFLKIVRWLEGWACRSADRVVALSEVDRDFMIQLYGVPPERFALIPHGVDPELFDHRPEGAAAARQALGVEAGTPLLTFVGKLDYLPNVRAVACIAERIAPAVWQRHPEARFVIVGQGVEAVAEYRRDGLLFTGFVDARAGAMPNLSDYLSASDVVLVPLDSGSGTRLKIVEAAANARPVVSTKIGAEGQSFVDGQEILLTDEADQAFIDATLRLLDDPALGERLGRAARSRVLAEYSWRSQVSKMERIYSELVPARPLSGALPVEDAGN